MGYGLTFAKGAVENELIGTGGTRIELATPFLNEFLSLWLKMSQRTSLPERLAVALHSNWWQSQRNSSFRVRPA